MNVCEMRVYKAVKMFTQAEVDILSGKCLGDRSRPFGVDWYLFVVTLFFFFFEITHRFTDSELTSPLSDYCDWFK